MVLPVPASPWRMVTAEREANRPATARAWSGPRPTTGALAPSGPQAERCAAAQPVNSFSESRHSREATSSPERSNSSERSRAASAAFKSTNSTCPRAATRASRRTTRSGTTERRSKTWASAERRAALALISGATRAGPFAAAMTAARLSRYSPHSANQRARSVAAVALVFFSRVSRVTCWSASWEVAPDCEASRRMARRRLLKVSRRDGGRPRTVKPILRTGSMR